MRITLWSECPADERTRLLKRSETDIESILEAVRRIVQDVQARGDDALYDAAIAFDHVDLRPMGLRVTEEELHRSEQETPPHIREAIDLSVENITTFHRHQAPSGLDLREVQPGVYAGGRPSPIDSVGLTVPHGRGRFPSTMYMLGVPASLAGVPRRVAVTPPGEGGRIDPAVLYAARRSGVSEIYRIGGAGGVAALAYGTESIPRVAKIVGPGSAWVTAAKRVASAEVDTGLPAGPSESIILADDSASPRIVALDLLVEAEHGSDSSALLVTPSSELVRQTQGIVESLVSELPEDRAEFVRGVLDGYGGTIVARDMDEAIEIVNLFACEHVEILTRDPFATMDAITNAGEILLGPHAPFTIANYSAGTNHVLPTGGRAATCSAVSVRDFMKHTSVVYLTRLGIEHLGPRAADLAEYEGFAAHCMAIRRRA